jgi:hypothetical protein
MILVGMLVGWKSFMISWNLGLYGLKFGKLSASVEDFLTIIAGIGAWFSMLLFTWVFQTKLCSKRVLKLNSVPVVISFMPSKDSRWLI